MAAAVAALLALAASVAPAAGDASATHGNASATSATSTYGNATATTNNKVYRITRISQGRKIYSYAKADANGAVAIVNNGKVTIVQPLADPSAATDRRRRMLDDRLLAVWDQADQSPEALLQGVKVALTSGANPNAADAHGTSLTHAADLGNLAIASFLLSKGASVNFQRDGIETPLMHAARSGQTEVVRLLLSKGAQANVVSADDKTALALAVSGSHPGVVSLLLKRGADANRTDEDGFTPLMRAIMSQDTALIDALLPFTSNINARNVAGETALMIAVVNDGSDAAVKLIHKGADIGGKIGWQSILSMAVMQNDVGLVKALIDAGADVHQDGLNGLTPEMRALLDRARSK